MEQAGTLFQKASRLNPADYQSLMSLGNCLQATNHPEEARQVFADALRVAERNLELYPDDVRALYLGAGALSQVGDRERSLEWASRALAIDSEESTILYNVACTYALLGEKEKALDCLEKAVRNGFGHKEWIENDPDFTILRDHPGYQALLKRPAADQTKTSL
jgi:adenylate cyclase